MLSGRFVQVVIPVQSAIGGCTERNKYLYVYFSLELIIVKFIIIKLLFRILFVITHCFGLQNCDLDFLRR